MSQIETKLEPDDSQQIYSPFHPSLLPPQCYCLWTFTVNFSLLFFSFFVFFYTKCYLKMSLSRVFI